ncbi:hypothetical protein [Phycicoccus flavus]|uniref:hypothetical protein n=1 Tax=Phycicoccus flavus TaxID=2502783 RepID=UPI000FEB830D|nr:hypothetical protein [Phycicoccus flavus]NHA69398.1 hypothetical protein [Phycicoccus flavus]
MSFENLPDTWSTLSLDDPALAADVVDLVVGHADRVGGCVALLLLDEGLRLRQPCVVGDVPDDADPAHMRPFVTELAGMVAAEVGALLFARGRAGSGYLTDADRAWHETVVAACREGGVRLVGAHLATPAGVRSFPAPLDEAAVAS